MARIARLSVLALTAAACAALPAAAPAATGHGNRCGKGHAKHSRAVAKRCAKRHARRRSNAAPQATTVPAAVVKACRDELAADSAAFQAKYANAAGREALGRCIRLNAEGAGADTTPVAKPDDNGTSDNPARVCAAERAADPDAFKAKYDPEGHEPFGHCVSAHAPAGDHGSGDQGSDQTDTGDAPDDGTTSDDEPKDPAAPISTDERGDSLGF